MTMFQPDKQVPQRLWESMQSNAIAAKGYERHKEESGDKPDSPMSPEGTNLPASSIHSIYIDAGGRKRQRRAVFLAAALVAGLLGPRPPW